MEYIHDILKLSRCNQIQILHIKSRAKYNFINMANYLSFINIPCLNDSIWNTLITECKHLHGIMLSCNSVNMYHRITDSNQTNNFIYAPNIWFLSIRSNHIYQSRVVMSMIHCCPNLHHLSLWDNLTRNVKL